MASDSTCGPDSPRCSVGPGKVEEGADQRGCSVHRGNSGRMVWRRFRMGRAEGRGKGTGNGLDGVDFGCKGTRLILSHKDFSTHTLLLIRLAPTK